MRPAILAAALLTLAAPAASAAGDGAREFRRYYVDIHAPAFGTASPGRKKFALREALAPVQFAVPKPAGVKRIFLIGGSVANFMARWTDSATLEARLGELKPGTTFEFINCGVPAYDAYRDSLVLKQALDLEPDAIVAMSGNNEFYTPVSIPHPQLTEWLGRLKKGGPPPRPDSAARDAGFGETLRAMARAARAKGVPLVFCTLPNNRQDLPPSGGEAVALFRRGEYARAADLDPDEHRCPPRRNELIRKIAAEEGALVADLDAEFGRLPDGLGFGVFYDDVHWIPELNPFVASVIARALAPALKLDEAATRAWSARSSKPRDADYWRAAVFAGVQTGERGAAASAALARRFPAEVRRLPEEKARFLERAGEVKSLWASGAGGPETWYENLRRSLAALPRK